MNTKLTLTIEQSVIAKAKEYALKRGRSLSDIIENYLKMLTIESGKGDFELTPVVKSLKGSFKAPEEFKYDEELEKSLTEKHLKL
ncbi:MAG: DUF6364 family protein [Candidatus Riflebacteria bacterium]